MKSILITIPGEPQAKARARFGKGRHYTPEKTVAYETKVAMYAKEATENHRLLDEPLAVRIEAYFYPSKALIRLSEKLEQPLEGVPCVKKPDADNVAKAVLDAMNKIVFNDDSSVYDLMVRKRYSLNPRVEVEIFYE